MVHSQLMKEKAGRRVEATLRTAATRATIMAQRMAAFQSICCGCGGGRTPVEASPAAEAVSRASER
jgi:hypothetical protein